MSEEATQKASPRLTRATLAASPARVQDVLFIELIVQ